MDRSLSWLLEGTFPAQNAVCAEPGFQRSQAGTLFRSFRPVFRVWFQEAAWTKMPADV